MYATRPQPPTQAQIDAAVARDRRQRNAKRADAITNFVAQATLAVAAGFCLMLAIGVVHHEWIRTCPTLGFGKSVVLAALLRGALLVPSAISKKQVSA